MFRDKYGIEWMVEFSPTKKSWQCIVYVLV
jgi:hypothetical protein